MMPIELTSEQEVVIIEETNFWKKKQRLENGYILKAGGAQITIPFEGITAFPMKTNKNERNAIKELTDGLSRMTITNKTEKRRSLN